MVGSSRFQRAGIVFLALSSGSFLAGCCEQAKVVLSDLDGLYSTLGDAINGTATLEQTCERIASSAELLDDHARSADAWAAQILSPRGECRDSDNPEIPCPGAIRDAEAITAAAEKGRVLAEELRS